MRKTIFMLVFLLAGAVVFAQGFYAEYSLSEIEGFRNSFELTNLPVRYEIIFHWTKEDIQNTIDRNRQAQDIGNVSFAFRRTAAEYMARMLRASADKRVFIIDTTVPQGPYGWIFIKINENEYVVLFTGT